MRRIRVLHIVPSLHRGGTEQLLYDILSKLDTSKFEICICCTHAIGYTEQHARFREVRVPTEVLSDAGGRGRLKQVVDIFRYLSQRRFDIVHIHNYQGLATHARIGAILARSPIIMTYDHAIREERWYHHSIWQVLNRFTFANVVVSEESRRFRLKCCGGQPEKVIMVRNGVDVELFKPAGAREISQVKASFGISPDHKVVGAVGRLVPWKRFDLFLRAAAKLADRDDVEFMLQGEGILETELKKLASSAGIADRVHFSPWRSDIHKLYHAFDVLTVTSTFQEGFGLVSAEAMACGKPVVAVNLPVHAEVITPSCGILVDPEPESIARGIRQLLDNPELARKLGAQGRRRAEEEFDIARTAKELSSLYEEATRSKAVRCQ